jgi:mono/diheme cytochrome c family protein
MRRPALVALGTILVFGLLAVLVAIAFETPKPPLGASLGERVYYRYCADCHGRDGRGSWRATLFVLRPGDLTDTSRMRSHSDAYLEELIKSGGAPLGKPGMPGFAFHLSDDQVAAVITYLRTLPERAGPP